MLAFKVNTVWVLILIFQWNFVHFWILGAGRCSPFSQPNNRKKGMCRWQLIANTDKCRCIQQRIHWLWGISASTAMFKHYLKKNCIMHRKILWKGNVWFSVQYGCHITTSGIISLLFLFYLYISLYLMFAFWMTTWTS